ncbi:hypothetical protein GW17_00033919, partial [Ensete ventricosum]
SVKSNIRTSFGMFLSSEDRQIPIIKVGFRCFFNSPAIEIFSQIPIENGEYIQVLSGTYCTYRPVWVSYRYRQYVGTLVRIEKLTRFLCTALHDNDAERIYSFQGLDGQSDPNSLHGACPVVKGEKWSATKWLRQGPTF